MVIFTTFVGFCLIFFSLQLFDRMKIENPQYRGQVQVVRGDCSQPSLGIDEADVNRIECAINVVIHLAATATSDNDPTLHEAVSTNVRATRDLIILAKRFPNLKVRYNKVTVIK